MLRFVGRYFCCRIFLFRCWRGKFSGWGWDRFESNGINFLSLSCLFPSLFLLVLLEFFLQVPMHVSIQITLSFPVYPFVVPHEKTKLHTWSIFTIEQNRNVATFFYSSKGWVYIYSRIKVKEETQAHIGILRNFFVLNHEEMFQLL